MNIENLQLVARNNTSETLLRLFLTMQQKSNQTNLDSFWNYLMKSGNNLDQNLYMNFFKELQDAGVGFLTNYRDQKFTKFLWNYNIKDVSEQILFPNKLVKIRPAIEEEKEEETIIPEVIVEKKKRGRPKGSKNLSVETDTHEDFIETIKRRGRKPSTKGVVTKEIIFMFTTSKGTVLPFELQDAERLLQQVEQIKSQISA